LIFNGHVIVTRSSFKYKEFIFMKTDKVYMKTGYFEKTGR